MDARRTVLFADVRDSTGLTEELGDTEGRRVLGALIGGLTGATESYRGTVVKTIGDEIMAAFEEPLDAALAAIQMQRDLLLHDLVAGRRPQVGIGLNGGTLVVEDGDLFGDVVNVAARLVASAAGGQILTTGETLASVQDHPELVWRSLGEHTFKGREEAVELCEILWRGETAQLTTLGPKIVDVPRATLELRLGGQHLHAASEAMQPIELGRSDECTLVVPAGSASRKHAKITARGGRFYLEDHSTNGTYVRQANGDELVVHRDEVLLAGAGHIRLGDPFTEPGPLEISFDVAGDD